MNATEWAAAAAMLLAACWTDIRRMEIPNALTISAAATGLVYQGIAAGPDGLARAGIGAVAGLLPMLAMYVLRGLGAGDVKWFAAFGIWAGAEAAWRLTVLSVLYAGAIAVLLLVLRLPAFARIEAGVVRLWGRPSGRLRGGMAFPFMLAVAPALLTLAVQA